MSKLHRQKAIVKFNLYSVTDFAVHPKGCSLRAKIKKRTIQFPDFARKGPYILIGFPDIPSGTVISGQAADQESIRLIFAPSAFSRLSRY